MAFNATLKRQRSSSGASFQQKTSKIATQVSGSRCSPTPSRPQSSNHFQSNLEKRLTSLTPTYRAEGTLSYQHGPSAGTSHAGSVALSDSGIAAEDDVAISEREENDALNEVVMALDVRNRDTVGCSYYVAREETLYLTADMKSGGIEIIETR